MEAIGVWVLDHYGTAGLIMILIGVVVWKGPLIIEKIKKRPEKMFSYEDLSKVKNDLSNELTERINIVNENSILKSMALAQKDLISAVDGRVETRLAGVNGQLETIHSGLSSILVSHDKQLCGLKRDISEFRKEIGAAIGEVYDKINDHGCRIAVVESKVDKK